METHRKQGNKIENFFLVRWIRKLFVLLLTIPVRIYQWTISPMLPRTCRYYPTCSEYAIESLRVHGPVLGLLLGTKRILSCNPWGGHGHDPVPPAGTPLKKLFKSGKHE
jgi:putative membrane protein insertion efficiency factor